MIAVNWKQWNSGPDESGLGQGRGMNYKALLKREESIAENCRCTTYRLLKMALKELYYNLSVFMAELLQD
jgi:hypothetical protein